MKFAMQRQKGGPQAPPHGLFNEHEKKRMAAMLFIFAVVVVALVYNFVLPPKGGAPPAAPEVAAPPTEIATPRLNVEQYRALAKDTTREERVLLETAALKLALEDALLYSWAHFEPMGGVDLDAAVAARLLAESEAQRGKVLRLRGTIEEIIEYGGGGELSAHLRGRIRLEDGTRAFFAFIKCVDGEFGVDDFVRIEGFFLKNFAQSAEGAWIDAPLVVGPRADRSYPALGPVAALAPEDLSDVEDDSLADGVSPTPVRPFWKLLRYARDGDMAAIDWSQAPLLDRALMERLSADPASFRGLPLRIPPTQVQGLWQQTQKENPARISALTEGWIGSEDWYRTPHPVARIVAPLPDPGLQLRDGMTGRGFFLRMFAYDSAGQNMQTAPLLVLASIEKYEPPKLPTISRTLIWVGGSFCALAVLFAFLMRRDSTKSAAFDAELVRRRRARRTQADTRT